MSKLAYITAALLAVPAPLVAQQAAPAPAKPPSALTDANKVVCRTQEEIGSRLQQHKVCMTNEQWKAYAQEYKDQVQEIQSQATVRASN
jgi:invasion protein IalB